MSASADRNLLLGVLALQMDFVSRDQLVVAMNTWVLEKSRSLADILREQQALSAEEHQLLSALVTKHMEKHGGDAQRSLAALSSLGSARDCLSRIQDPGVQATLDFVGKGKLSEPADPDRTLSVGQSTSQGTRFRVLRPHAKGGLGEVFVARDEELHREVALKEIQIEFAYDEQKRSRFVLEAEITGGLEHPGIVPVYGLGQYADGRPFYAMRFIRGDSLKDAIERYHLPEFQAKSEGERTLELRKLLGRFIDICNAVGYAHSRGVLHRDLKPGNIMLGKYGETLLIDWGLAKAAGRSEELRNRDYSKPGDSRFDDERVLNPNTGRGSTATEQGSVFGTPAYMSPEQAAGLIDELGPASDVFSLGATLYCLLTGKPPQHDPRADTGTILKRVKQGEFPRPRQLDSKISRPLEAICLKAMALKPGDRYSSPATLADDIEHWLADEPVSAHAETPVERSSRFVRKHRSWALASAASLTLIAAVSLIAVFLVNQSRKAAVVAQENEKDQREQVEVQKGKVDEANRALVTQYAVVESKKKEVETTNKQLEERNVVVERQKQDLARQLRRSQILTLVATSQAVRKEYPQRSVLLAVTAAEETLSGGAPLSLMVRQNLYDSLAGIGGKPLIGHFDEVTSTATSPDGRWLVTGSQDKTARLWDLKRVEERASSIVLRGHKRGITSVAFSSDSKWLATGSSDGAVRLWDLKRADVGSSSIVLRGGGYAAFSPDGKWLATTGGPIVWLWDLKQPDVAANSVVLNGHEHSVHSVAFSPDSKWLATGGGDDKTARLWDLKSANVGANNIVLKGDEYEIWSVAFSPDGKWLAAAGPWQVPFQTPGICYLWNLASANVAASRVILKGHRDHVTSVAFSPDGKWLATCSDDKTAQLWDLKSADVGASNVILRGHENEVISLAFSPDGKWLATGSRDRAARLWKVGSRDANSIVLKGHEASVYSVAFTPDSKHLATASGDKTARLWDVTDSDVGASKFVLKHREASGFWGFSRDGKWLAMNPPAVGGKRIVLKNNEYFRGFSPDGRWLATSFGEGTARLWDLNSADARANSVVLTNGHEKSIYDVAFSPDSKWLATSCHFENIARIWDLKSADVGASSVVLKAHDGSVYSVVFSPDNKWLATTAVQKHQDRLSRNERKLAQLGD